MKSLRFFFRSRAFVYRGSRAEEGGWREVRGRGEATELSAGKRKRTRERFGRRERNRKIQWLDKMGGKSERSSQEEEDAEMGTKNGATLKKKKGRGQEKKIRGFSMRRVEWLGGRIIELPLIPSSPLSPG